MMSERDYFTGSYVADFVVLLLLLRTLLLLINMADLWFSKNSSQQWTKAWYRDWNMNEQEKLQ